jgi:hypothetical protein
MQEHFDTQAKTINRNTRLIFNCNNFSVIKNNRIFINLSPKEEIHGMHKLFGARMTDRRKLLIRQENATDF